MLGFPYDFERSVVRLCQTFSESFLTSEDPAVKSRLIRNCFHVISGHVKSLVLENNGK